MTLLGIYQFCMWLLMVVVGTILYCLVKTLWEWRVREDIKPPK